MIAAETAPYSRVGGLGDVVAALSGSLRAEGVDVRTISPLYPSVREFTLRKLGSLKSVEMGSGHYEGAVYVDPSQKPAINVFIENEEYFDRPGTYTDPATGEGYPDNFERFNFFRLACLELFRRINWEPDIVHCHDAHTALIPAYLKADLAPERLKQARSIFTVHNLAYQEIYASSLLSLTGLPESEFYLGGPLEFYGNLNLMKAGISYADKITTVSPRYAAEIQTSEYGCGLEGVLRERESDLTGISNGVDVETWNPEVDPDIAASYSRNDLSGKAVNKQRLQQLCGFPEKDVPLLGMVTRLAEQKGIELLLAVAPDVLEMGAQLVILGQGNLAYQDALRDLARRNPDQVSVHLEFNNVLSHQIEAGSDIFLMPSRFEPSGLNQMYSMLYGTLPVVRFTGGLADTVQEFNADSGQGNGFVFHDYHPAPFLDTIRRAIALWRDETSRTRMIRNAMSCDFSWRKSATNYVDLYRSLVGDR